MLMIDNIFKNLLISDFEVFRKQRTPDGAGGNETVLVKVGDIKGRLSLRGTALASDYVRAMQDISAYVYILFTLPNVDIKKDDIVVGEGRDLRVVIIKEPSHMGHHLEIELVDMVPSGGV